MTTNNEPRYYNPNIGLEKSIYRVSSEVGGRNTGIAGASTNHKGRDFGTNWQNRPEGIKDAPIPAAADGKIAFSGVIGGYGNCVVIEHHDDKTGEAVYTFYAHMNKLEHGKISNGKNEQGEVVHIKEGDIVGPVGNTNGGRGANMHPHLHMEIRTGIPKDANISGSTWGTFSRGVVQNPATYDISSVRHPDPARSIVKDVLAQTEQKIETKFDRINTLNAKLEALDKTTQANEIVKVEADIQAERATLAQLELDRQQEIDRQQAALAEDKESIVGEMVLGALKVGVLTELNDQLGGLSNSPDDLKKAESLFKESGLALSTSAEATLAEKGSLDLTNKEDVTALQNVLYERGLIASKVRGNFLSQTQGGLRTALGLPDDHQFGASLSAAEMNQLTQPSMETLQTRVNTELENEKSAQAVLETKKTEIDTKISELENHRPDIYEQKIANQPSHDQIHELQGQQIQHLQDQIALKEQVQAALQKDIDRNDQRINEVEGLQASLYARTDIDPEKPVYTQIKADLEKADVQLSLGAEKDAFYVSINTKDKTQATALQDYLIEHKYLDPKYLNSKGVERDANDGDFGNRSKTALNKALEGSDVPKPYINDKGEVSKEALTALRDKELDGLTKEQLVTKIDAYKTELEADNKALISEKAEIVQGVKQLEDRVADKVAVREVQKESEHASIQLTDPTKSSLMMEGDRPILMVAGKSYDLSEFNEVKGMNLFRSRDNSLIGRINDEGSLEVFQKVSSGSAVKLAEIENIKEQNMVTLNEASLSHSRALSQNRDQDQGRSIG